MTSTSTTDVAVDVQGDARIPDGGLSGRLHGIRTVAALELRMRTRTRRWPWIIGGWAAVNYAVIGLTWYATRPRGSDDYSGSGEAVYSTTVMFVMFMALLIVPSLTSTAINSDREHGVLATLQTTLLTASDIVLGKLLASLAVAGVLMATMIPVFVVCLSVQGVTVGTLLMAFLTYAVVIGVVCAFGLFFSSAVARPVASVLLSYLTVASLCVGTAITFGLTLPFVEERGVSKQWANAQYTPDGVVSSCKIENTTVNDYHTERTSWLLFANPFVIIADAAPGFTAERHAGGPLAILSESVRSATYPQSEEAVCPAVGTKNGSTNYIARQKERQDRIAALPPVWPWGFGLLFLLGALATWSTIRRVTMPIAKLPKGVRIA